MYVGMEPQVSRMDDGKKKENKEVKEVKLVNVKKKIKIYMLWMIVAQWRRIGLPSTIRGFL